MPNDWIIPDWDAPARVRAVSTTRHGGISRSPWEGLNLGLHVGDDDKSVQRNRDILVEKLGLTSQPFWLNQVHGVSVANASNVQDQVDADASFCCKTGPVCVVMTADCLPVILTDHEGSCVAAAHAGWRGLLDGVLEATIEALPADNSSIIAWMGPAIGPQAFEVGAEVYAQFTEQSPDFGRAFSRGEGDKWMMDIYEIAKQRMLNMGIHHVYGGGLCTYSDPERFFSYRRDGQTGRMATLVWLES